MIGGGGGLIEDGATQWMTAGSGILHIETPPAELVESGGLFHGVQLWVNLPKKAKFATPAEKPWEMSADDIDAVVDDFRAASTRAHRAGVFVEGELGEVGGKDGVHAPGARTDPADAATGRSPGGGRP